MIEPLGRVLITGVGGAIGSAVAELLTESGASVVGLDVMESDKVLEGVSERHIIADIRDRPTVRKAIADVDSVVHLAGWVHLVPRCAADVREVYSVNYQAARDIADCCRTERKKLVFASTVAVYGDQRTGRLTEDSPTRPDSAYGKAKLDAEGPVLEARGTVLRLPMVYGAFDKGNMAKMIGAILRGWFVVPGRGEASRTFVGRWNVAHAVELCLRKDASRGQVYHVTDDESTQLGDLVDLISRLLGCRRPVRVPKALVACAALSGSVIQRISGKQIPVSWSTYLKLVRELCFDGERIRMDLGYAPIRTLADGLQEEVDWFVERQGRSC